MFFGPLHLSLLLRSARRMPGPTPAVEGFTDHVTVGNRAALPPPHPGLAAPISRINNFLVGSDALIPDSALP